MLSKGFKQRNKVEQEAELNLIYGLLCQGLGDRQIIEQLGIPSGTFYWYKHKLHERAAKQFAKQDYSDIALHKEILREKLANIYSLCMKKLESATNTDKGENNPTRDFAGTAAIAQEVALNMFKLDMFGITELRSRALRKISTYSGMLPAPTEQQQEQEPEQQEPTEQTNVE